MTPRVARQRKPALHRELVEREDFTPTLPSLPVADSATGPAKLRRGEERDDEPRTVSACIGPAIDGETAAFTRATAHPAPSFGPDAAELRHDGQQGRDDARDHATNRDQRRSQRRREPRAQRMRLVWTCAGTTRLNRSTTVFTHSRHDADPVSDAATTVLHGTEPRTRMSPSARPPSTDLSFVHAAFNCDGQSSGTGMSACAVPAPCSPPSAVAPIARASVSVGALATPARGTHGRITRSLPEDPHDLSGLVRQG